MCAKEKHEGEQKIANVNSMKLGGGQDFQYDVNLKGIIVEGHEWNSFAVGVLASISEDPAERKSVGTDLRRYFAEKKL